MYKPTQNYQIAELIMERLTSPVACELTHIFRGSFEPRMTRARLSDYLIPRPFQLMRTCFNQVCYSGREYIEMNVNKHENWQV